MKNLFTLLISLIATTEMFAGIFVVNVKQTQLYAKPNGDAEVVANIRLGTQVKILNENGDWKEVKVGRKQTGWIWGKYVEEVPEWKKVKIKTGDMPKQYSITPVVDKSINNYLRITTSKGTEAIVKLMKMSEETVNFADTCVRVAYIGSGKQCTMKNIPLGKYYVKVAYGREYSKTTIDGVEYEGFKLHETFEIMQSSYDFYQEREANEDGTVTTKTMSYNLSLDFQITESEDEDNTESAGLKHSLITKEVFEK